MYIGIDFDGTCVTHDYPQVGKDIGAVPILKKLVEQGHQLILFTMRSDKPETTNSHFQVLTEGELYLSDAVNWFKQNDIPLYGIQTNPTQLSWTTSPKAYCHLYIDDAGLGCPLTFNQYISSRPFVNWTEVEKMLKDMSVIK